MATETVEYTGESCGACLSLYYNDDDSFSETGDERAAYNAGMERFSGHVTVSVDDWGDVFFSGGDCVICEVAPPGDRWDVTVTVDIVES